MKNLIAVAVVLALGIAGIAYAQPRGNASPAIVELSGSTLYHEVTFPQTVRDVIIENYDSTAGIWVNLKGSDTSGVEDRSSRQYIAPSSSLSLYDYMTDAVTIWADVYFTSDLNASPITVLGVY